MEFLSAFDAHNGFTSGQWADFLDERGIDQSRAVNADEAVGEEFFSDGRDGLAEKKCGAGEALEQNVVTLGFDGHNLGGIDKQDFAIGFDGNSG
jgi:hypothetical protein